MKWHAERLAAAAGDPTLETQQMKFGLFTHIPWPEGKDPKQVLDHTTEEVVYAEEIGFHSAWVAEHHFSRYGLGSSSLVFSASVAAQTKKIRLGTAILVPPLHHPIKLAEDAATLDLVSGGRLDAGFGRGTAGYEYAGYNVDQGESQERFQETISIVQGLWTTPGFSYSGKYFDVEEVNLVPPPMQKPHPPIYIAATRTPATLDYVAASGHPLIIGVVLDIVDAVDLCHRYVEKSKEAGYDVPISRIPFFRYVYVGETKEQARKDTEAELSWTLDMGQWRRTFERGSEVYHKMDDWRKERTELPTSNEHLYDRRAIIGTPAQCVAQIKELQSQGIEYFGCNFSFGAMEQGKMLRSMKLFAEEVMPHFN